VDSPPFDIAHRDGGQPYEPAHRFNTLDAMRGIGALAVMGFHYLWGLTGLFSQAFFGVDFFFCLSGVILVHAYAKKIDGGLSFAGYMHHRVNRLGPFYFIGFALGAILLMSYRIVAPVPGFGPFDHWLAIVFGLIALPYPNHGALPFVGTAVITGPLFPTNIPAWSLFFEMVASAALFVALKQRVNLMAIATCSGFVWLAAAVIYRTDNVGWGISTFAGGFPRTAFMFFLGATLYGWFRRYPRRLRLSPWVLLVTMAAALAAPLLPLGVAGKLAQTAALVSLAPCAVLLGLKCDDRRPRPVFAYLGRMSYGIYAVHWPVYHLLALAFGAWAATRRLVEMPLLFAAVAAMLGLGLAHGLTVYVDEPIRRRLSARARQQLRGEPQDAIAG